MPLARKTQKKKNHTKRLKFKECNICPDILHADANMDASSIALALLH